jgi:choline dehydrogenase-like flavoprotein
MDISTDARYAFLRGKCVGGGSVVNQCLLDRFDDVALDDWREKSGIDFFSEDNMVKHYDEVQKLLQIKELPPEYRNRNAQIFIDGSEKSGFKWSPLERGENNCAIDKGNDCIVCLGGCHRNSKQSMLVSFLPKALEQGLVLETDFYIDHIESDDNKVVITGNGKTIESKKAFIASGSLGTNHLLLKSGFKKDYPALGKGFFCHPQIMNFAVFDEPVNAHKGSFQTVKSDDPNMRKIGYKLENVFAQPIGFALLYNYFGKKHQEWMKKYSYIANIEVAVRDVGKGTLSIDKKKRLKIKKKISSEDKKRGKAGMEAVRNIFEKMGAKEIYHAPIWFGLHLMGGCAIGTDPNKSIVNEKFQMHKHKNIFIADSSIFPSAPGINPALTIMALSQKATEQF